ncbi:hypothetical protein VTI28DRAFT_10024 [Corynascus sepedonium]
MIGTFHGVQSSSSLASSHQTRVSFKAHRKFDTFAFRYPERRSGRDRHFAAGDQHLGRPCIPSLPLIALSCVQLNTGSYAHMAGKARHRRRHLPVQLFSIRSPSFSTNEVPLRYTGIFRYINRRFFFFFWLSIPSCFRFGFHHRFGENGFFLGIFRVSNLCPPSEAQAEWTKSAQRALVVDG